MDSTPAPDSQPKLPDEESIKALVQPAELEMSIHQLTAYKLQVKATGNPYLLAHLLSHLGHMQVLRRTFEAARETLNEADFVLIEAAQRDSREIPEKHRAWLRYMVERARFFALTGWSQSARSMADEAVEMARATGHFDLFQEANKLQQQLALQES
ncbi:MAG: hypothetical protein U0931_40140 [Vulcanimicrobiota bacterium]